MEGHLRGNGLESQTNEALFFSGILRFLAMLAGLKSDLQQKGNGKM